MSENLGNKTRFARRRLAVYTVSHLVCSTWLSGNDLAWRVESPEFDFGQNLFLFASFILFLFLFP